MKRDFSQRFGFIVKDVAKRYGEAFDRLARERIGLSSAQCRLLGVLAMEGEEAPLSQAELAQRLELTPMAVGGLCDRMEAAGWIRNARVMAVLAPGERAQLLALLGKVRGSLLEITGGNGPEGEGR